MCINIHCKYIFQNLICLIKLSLISCCFSLFQPIYPKIHNSLIKSTPSHLRKILFSFASLPDTTGFLQTQKSSPGGALGWLIINLCQISAHCCEYRGYSVINGTVHYAAIFRDCTHADTGTHTFREPLHGSPDIQEHLVVVFVVFPHISTCNRRNAAIITVTTTCRNSSIL